MNKIHSYGRVCFFGEHTDWASEFQIYDGRALAAPISLGIAARAMESEVFTIFENNRKNYFENEELLSIAYDKTNYYRYVCSAVFLVKKHFTNVANIDVFIDYKDLPIRAGLSSSAAISNLIVKAFDVVYNLHLTEIEIMDISYEAERLTGSSCGRLDQIGVLKRCLYDLKFHDTLSYKQCEVNGEWNFFIVILGRNKDTSKILNDLKGAYLANLDIQNYLGPIQNKIVEEAIDAFKVNDLKKMGKLLNMTQQYFDDIMLPISYKELSAPKFHSLVCDHYISERILGAKEIGSHGDGTALFLAENKLDCNDCMQYIQDTYGYQCALLDI